MQAQGDETKLLQKTKQTRQKYQFRSVRNMQGKQVKGIPLQMNLQNCCYKEPVLI